MEKYFDSALLIGAIGMLIHINRCIHDLKRKIDYHVTGHFHVLGSDEEQKNPTAQGGNG